MRSECRCYSVPESQGGQETGPEEAVVELSVAVVSVVSEELVEDSDVTFY